MEGREVINKLWCIHIKIYIYLSEYYALLFPDSEPCGGHDLGVDGVLGRRGEGGEGVAGRRGEGGSRVGGAIGRHIRTSGRHSSDRVRYKQLQVAGKLLHKTYKHMLRRCHTVVMLYMQRTYSMDY